MPYYKDTLNNTYLLDFAGQIDTIPTECIQIGEDEWLAIQATRRIPAPTPGPLQQIRSIEARPDVADAFVRATRQLLLGIWFQRVKAKPAAANLSDDQIEVWCRANDPTYKTLAETEDAIKPLRPRV